MAKLHSKMQSYILSIKYCCEQVINLQVSGSNRHHNEMCAYAVNESLIHQQARMGHLGQDIKDDPNRIIDFMLLFIISGNMLWDT